MDYMPAISYIILPPRVKAPERTIPMVFKNMGMHGDLEKLAV